MTERKRQGSPGLGSGAAPVIRDRIKEFRRVPASELVANPKNWRRHPQAQLDAIRGVLKEVGFAGAELARELPDGTLMLIDGHARASIMGDAPIPVLVLDVTEAEADKLLATFDPIGAMAEADAGVLDALLRDLETGDKAIANLLTSIAEDAGIVPKEDTPTDLRPLEVKPPPKMSWVLIGIPTVQFGELAELVAKASQVAGAIVETAAVDG